MFRVILNQPILNQREFTVSDITPVNGMLVKGNYRTPISNIKYIEEI